MGAGNVPNLSLKSAGSARFSLSLSFPTPFKVDIDFLLKEYVLLIKTTE